MSLILFLMSPMWRVDFKKKPCRHVKLRGQGPPEILNLALQSYFSDPSNVTLNWLASCVIGLPLPGKPGANSAYQRCHAVYRG